MSIERKFTRRDKNDSLYPGTLLSNMDKKMTVEKAHFESNTSDKKRQVEIKMPKKMKRKPTSSSTQVFHQNLTDAVSNTPDTDEHYVYPLYSPRSERRPLFPNKTINDWRNKQNDNRPNLRTFSDHHSLSLSDCKRTAEDQPLLGRPRSKDKRLFICSVIAGFSILCLLLVLYTAKPLRDLEVTIGRVLAKDKELIFDFKISADNQNSWEIRIKDVNVSVFAFINRDDPAEYLCKARLKPLMIPPNHSKAIVSQVCIRSPNKQWSHMISGDLMK
ncbi:hypothetical protein G6F56_008352 [Rhizopus delemar]|nr:hypothetical protein G6F56_008352 [Rhizopus delemar]